MYKQSESGGRPLKFKSVAELQEKIDEYFASCYDFARDMFGNRLVDKDNLDADGKPTPILRQVKPFTITGLAVYLGTFRNVLMDYESGKYDDTEKDADTNAQFSNTIKEAKAKIYAYAEESLFIGKNASGVIFNMKNNFGWKDEQIIRSSPIEMLPKDTEDQIDAKINSVVAET